MAKKEARKETCCSRLAWRNKTVRRKAIKLRFFAPSENRMRKMKAKKIRALETQKYGEMEQDGEKG